jgi:hypothetical protein
LLPEEAGEARNDFVATARDLLGLEVPASLYNPQPAAPASPQGLPPDQGIPSQLSESLAANVQGNGI